MKARILPVLSLTLALLAGAAAGWAQEPDGGAPPPPPEGKFFFVRGGPMSGEVKPVTGAPFSATVTTQTTQVLADGNQINHSETATVYRDSSGRTRRDSGLSQIGPWSSAGPPRQIVNITDPVAGASYLLDLTDKTVVKLPFHEHHGVGPNAMPKWKERGVDGSGNVEFGPPAAQKTTESLGTQMMAGVSAQGTRTTETIPAGTMGNQNPIVIVSERWYSPELQETVYSKRTDPRFGTTIRQLTNINRQEPDATLFQVPSDYTVRQGPAFHMKMRRVE
ncbi:MAG TPA: hypothetical protein VL523_14065 [Terriglobia bacterium]|nr:hypothetical protein [Terriglobia bacterium]